MEVLCLEDAALYALVGEVTARIREKFNKPDKCISDEEPTKKLNISSKINFQKFRIEGRIRFSKPERKIILYDRDSIDACLEKQAKNSF